METKIKIKGVVELPNGDLEIQTKDGLIVLTDPVSDEMTRAMKRNKGSEVYGLLSSMIVSIDGKEEKVGELAIKKFRGSTLTKLQAASDILLGGDTFLLEETDSEMMVSTDENA